MNVLILNSIGRTKWGGGEKWMLLAAKGLIEKGHRVIIGCHRGSVLGAKAKAQSIEVAYFDIYSDISLIGAIELIRFGKKLALDVIIGCQNRDVRISGIIKGLIGNPLVFSRQGVHLIHNSWKHKITFTRFCDGIITNTETIKNEYDSYGWWDSNFVHVIHNGVEQLNNSTESFNYNSYIEPSSEKPFIVLSAGRLSTQKGYQYLIDAAQIVCSKNSNCYFFIAGQGKLHRQLSQRISELGLDKRVFLLGFQKSLVPLFKGANLFVLSSLYEGMPNVVMEAMMNRVPVISTNVNGVGELMRNGIDGHIVEKANAAAIAQSVLSVIESSDGEKLAINAYERITTNFSVSRMVNQLEGLLIEQISKQKRKSCLIIQTAFIGDVILATPLIEAIKATKPNCDVDFLLRKGNEGLFTNHPLLRNTLIFDKQSDKYRRLFELLKLIRKNKYDWVINIQRYSTTGFLTTFSGAQATIGFSKNPFSFAFTHSIKHQMSKDNLHEIDRNLSLLKYLGVSSRYLPKLYPSKEDFDFVTSNEPYVCMAPTSVWFTKQYPLDKWVELIDSFPKGYRILLLGAKGDKQICEEIKAQSSNSGVSVKAGELTFLQSAALMNGAKMNYVNDSAPLHIASAMNAPVRAMFCSTVPSFGYTPLSDDSLVLETEKVLSCRPCGLHGKKKCPINTFECGDISVDRIIMSSNIKSIE